VDLMQVLQRPHLPRLISVSVVAAVIAIATSFALARGLSTITQPSNYAAFPVGHTAPALVSAHRTNAPRWASSPFASPLNRPVQQPWPAARL
jgi:hypothetical protein